MANGAFAKFKQRLFQGDIDWLATVKVVLIDVTLYTVDLDNDEFLSDVPSGARIATSSGLSFATTTDGVADASDINFALLTGPEVRAMVVYQEVGGDSTSPLMVYIDEAVGFPLTPNGTDVPVIWHSDGIIRLVG